MKLPAVRARNQDTFLSGVRVLTLSAAGVKVLGLLCRIPLLNALGTGGMGYFNTALDIFAFFAAVAASGLPTAMAVTLSALPDPQGRAVSDRVLSAAACVFLPVGLAGAALLWLTAAPLGRLMGSPDAAACIRAAAPAAALICLSGILRGLFQGKHNMTPTAVSQLTEAACKPVLGLTFAYAARAGGADLPHTAAAAVWGVTAGICLSALYLLIRKKYADRRAPDTGVPDGLPARRVLLRRLLSVALPAAVGAGAVGLSRCLDLALILRRLQDTGLSAAGANALWGCWSTLAVPLWGVLPALTAPIATSAVPALSGALCRLRSAASDRDRAAARGDLSRTSSRALGLTLALSVPAGLGICLFSHDILLLLFPAQPAAAATAAPWLSVLGLSVPAACLVALTGAMLQAAGHAAAPVVSMCTGLGVKAVLSYILIGQQSVGVTGAAVAALVCDTLVLTVNTAHLARVCPALLPDGRTMVSLFLCPLALSVPALWASPTLAAAAGLRAGTPACTVVTVASTALLYGAGMLVCLMTAKRRSHQYGK